MFYQSIHHVKTIKHVYIVNILVISSKFKATFKVLVAFKDNIKQNMIHLFLSKNVCRCDYMKTRTFDDNRGAHIRNAGASYSVIYFHGPIFPHLIEPTAILHHLLVYYYLYEILKMYSHRIWMTPETSNCYSFDVRQL